MSGSQDKESESHVSTAGPPSPSPVVSSPRHSGEALSMLVEGARCSGGCDSEESSGGSIKERMVCCGL